MATVEGTSPAPGAARGALLFNPRTYDAAEFDPETRRVLLATIEFFESRGKKALKENDHERTWYADFLEFVAREKVFATLLTPAAEAAGDPDKRWDTARIAAFNEITAFYGLVYWYTWQVTILGLGPIWQSAQRRRPRARRGAAGRGRDLRLRPVRARARRRHLLHRHGARRPPATAASRRPAASTTSATATRRAWSRCSAAAPTWRARRATCSSPPTAATSATGWSRTW